MPSHNGITDRPSPAAEAVVPVEFAPEVRAVADAMRAAAQAGAIEPYWEGSRFGVEGPIETSAALPHDAELGAEHLCGCVGCRASAHHQWAEDAARAGDQAKAEHHQQIGDAWFRLSEAARAGQLPGRIGEESTRYAASVEADMRLAIAESGAERSDQEAEAER
jgi:hypothetical protein